MLVRESGVAISLHGEALKITFTVPNTGSRSTLNFRAGSTFPVPVCTVPHGHWVNKADNQQD